MGFDTHMILETVPVPPRNTRTLTTPSTGHHTTLPGPWCSVRLWQSTNVAHRAMAAAPFLCAPRHSQWVALTAFARSSSLGRH